MHDNYILRNTLKDAYKSGVEFDVSNKQIKYKAPNGLPKNIKEVITYNREAFIELLEKEAAAKIVSVSKDSKIKFPATQQQSELFLLQERDKNSALYNIPRLYKIEGLLEYDKLINAFQRLVNQYEILRTSFHIDSNLIQGQIKNSVEVGVKYVVLDKEQALNDIVKGYVHQAFDLKNPPLAKLIVIEHDNQTHLLFILHHIVADDFTVNKLFSCLASYYTGNDFEKVDSDMMHEMKEYAVWQEKWLQSVDAELKLEYWEEKLKNIKPLVNLSKNTASEEENKFTGERCEFEFPNRLYIRLEEFVKMHGITEYPILLSAYSLLLHIYFNHDQIIIGSAFSNRDRPALMNTAGYLVNPVLFINDIDYEKNNYALLHAAQNQIIELQNNKEIPFGAVLANLDQENRKSLNQFMFDYVVDVDSGSVSFDNFPAIPAGFDFQLAKVPLLLSFRKTKSNMLALFEWQKLYFDISKIKNLWSHYLLILEQLLDGKSLSKIEFRLPSEMEIINTYNNTYTHADTKTNLLEMFSEQIKLNYEKPAIKHNNKWITYGELDVESTNVTIRLQKIVEKSDIVAICMKRSVEMFYAIFAILKLGATYLPIDPDYPLERKEYMLKDSNVSVILTDNEIFDKKYHVISLSKLERYNNNQLMNRTINKNDLAYVIYTSGSTGKPKGVQVTHGNVINYITWFSDSFAVNDDKIFDFSSSLSFDLSVTSTLLPLLYGAKVVITDQEIKKDPVLYLDHLEKNEVNFIKTTPSYFSQIINFSSVKLLSKLEYIILGGEALPATSVKKWLNMYPRHSIVNEYGPTEATVATCAYVINKENMDNDIFTTYPIGYPAFNTSIYVLNNHGKQCPLDAAGEIYISGDSVTLGYLNRNEETKKKFINDSSNTKYKMYRTGDLGFWTEKTGLIYKGRADSQVKVRGYRIELGEITSVIQELKDVCDVYLLIKELNYNKKIIAYYTSNNELTTESVKEQLQKKLPDYMLPHHIVQLKEMPLTVNHKIDTTKLPDPETSINNKQKFKEDMDQKGNQLINIVNKVLGQTDLGLDEDLFACGADSISCLQILAQAKTIGLKFSVKDIFESRTIRKLLDRSKKDNENTIYIEHLKKIWQEVFLLSEVDVDADFFAFGGDSIVALQILSKSHQKQIQFTIQDLFELRTIRKLSQKVKKITENTNEKSLVDIQARLLPMQKWFFELGLKNNNHWNQAIEIGVSEKIDHHVLKQVVQAIYDSHLVFHYSYNVKNMTYDIFPGNEEYDIFETVVCYDNEIIKKINLEQEKLDIEKGRLFKALLFIDDSDKVQRFVIIAHHLCVDAVSWRIIADELNKYYKILLKNPNGREIETKEGEFLRWSAYLNGNEYKKLIKSELPFWQAQLSNTSARINVDVNGKNTEKEAKVSIWLAENNENIRVLKVASELKISPRDILALALIRALNERESNLPWLINFEHHGRTLSEKNIDLSGAVGWFTSLYPLRFDLSSLNNNALAEIKYVREKLEGVPNNGLNYSILKENINLELQRSHTPQICFNYLGKFSESHDENNYFSILNTTLGYERARENLRPHLLDVNSLFSNNELKIYWYYSSSLLSEKYINRLLKTYAYQIQSILNDLEECVGFLKVPNDYQHVEISQKSIDRLIGKFGNNFELAPSTIIQQGFIFHHLQSDAVGEYLTQLSWNLVGDLDLERYIEAWDYVYKKYAILRSAFVLQGVNTPIHIVLNNIDLPLVQYDWSSMSDKEKEDALENLLRTDRKNGFDITTPSLSRLFLIKEGNQSYKTIWTYDHTIIDGWSLSIMLNTLFDFYEQLPVDLADDNAFFDYTKWFAKQKTINPKKNRFFWKKYLEGYAESAKFPITENISKTTASSESESAYLNINQNLTDSIKSYVREKGITLNTLIQGVWSILLGSLGQKSDVLIGVTVSGRNQSYPNIQNIAGMFINTLPLRIKLESQVLFSDWLHDIQKNMREIAEFEDTSLTEVGEAVDKNIAELISTNIVFENYPVKDKILSNQDGVARTKKLSISAPTPYIQSGYPISLIIIPGDELGIKITYHKNKFEQDFIVALQNSIEDIFMQITSSAFKTLDEVKNIVTNHTKAQKKDKLFLPANKNSSQNFIFEQIEKYAQINPEKLAMYDQHENNITFYDLKQKILQLANHLRQLNINPNQMIGICASRSIEAIIAMLAINKAGCAYVPIDPALPQERINYILNDTQMSYVICHSEFSYKFDTVKQILPLLPVSKVWEYPIVDELETISNQSDLMYVIYTSGSTGKPKGVQIEHNSVINYVAWAGRIFENNPGSVAVLHSSLNFDISITSIFPPLVNGHSLYVIDESKGIQGLIDIFNIERKEKFSFIKLTPTHLKILKDVIQDDLSNYFNVIMVGGESLLKHHIENINLDKCWLINHYGPTETTCGCCANLTINSDTLNNNSIEISIGKPILNTSAYILNDHLESVKTGQIGELYIGGQGLARGYLNLGELTKQRFITLKSGEHVYKTGDLAKQLPDQSLQFIGRIDHQVKINGYRVELGEIEALLLDHGDLNKAVVVAKTQDNNIALVAFVESGDFRPTKVEIREYLQEYLPEYMLPADIIFVDELPMTSSGKIDRKLLGDLYLNSLHKEKYIKNPSSELEKNVHSVWCAVFNKANLSMDDNFFEIGGHSLRAVQIITRIGNQLDMRIPLETLFQHPTIESFCIAIEAICSISCDIDNNSMLEI